MAALETGARAAVRPALRALSVVAPVLCVTALGWAVADAWWRCTPEVAPRHRAEALCFTLAARPRFAPPMTVEPSAALVRGRFSPSIPPGMALREVMHFDERMVIDEHTRRIGDYDVAAVWLRMPGTEAARRWLVVAWMEGADLAVCNFRFAADGDDLTPDERVWGARLLARVLVPQNFTRGALPAVRLRWSHDGELPSFGPKPRG